MQRQSMPGPQNESAESESDEATSSATLPQQQQATLPLESGETAGMSERRKRRRSGGNGNNSTAQPPLDDSEGTTDAGSEQPPPLQQPQQQASSADDGSGGASVPDTLLQPAAPLNAVDGFVSSVPGSEGTIQSPSTSGAGALLSSTSTSATSSNAPSVPQHPQQQNQPELATMVPGMTTGPNSNTSGVAHPLQPQQPVGAMLPSPPQPQFFAGMTVDQQQQQQQLAAFFQQQLWGGLAAAAAANNVNNPFLGQQQQQGGMGMAAFAQPQQPPNPQQQQPLQPQHAPMAQTPFQPHALQAAFHFLNPVSNLLNTASTTAQPQQVPGGATTTTAGSGTGGTAPGFVPQPQALFPFGMPQQGTGPFGVNMPQAFSSTATATTTSTTTAADASTTAPSNPLQGTVQGPVQQGPMQAAAPPPAPQPPPQQLFDLQTLFANASAVAAASNTNMNQLQQFQQQWQFQQQQQQPPLQQQQPMYQPTTSTAPPNNAVHTSNNSTAAGTTTATTTTTTATEPVLTGRPPIVLYITCDDDSLSEYQCMVRKQIELFEATKEDVESNAQGRNRAIIMGQVGIRCRHCNMLPPKHRARGAIYYPAKLHGIYQAAQNMASSHLGEHCQHVPVDVRTELVRLRDRKSSAGGGKNYWADGVRVLGVYEDDVGLRFTASLSTPATGAGTGAAAATGGSATAGTETAI